MTFICTGNNLKNEVFMDTAFLIAVIDKSDQYHNKAVEYYKKLIYEKWTVFTTEAVLIEICNGLSKLKFREVAYEWVKRIRTDKNIFKVIPITTEIYDESINLYGTRLDKEWGLTDCISFIVMKKYNLMKALTVDHHFEQAGYQVLIK